MNFGFSDEQEELRRVAARVLSAEAGPELAARVLRDPDAWRPVWKTLVELGFGAVAVPESCGGLGGGVVDLVALLEVAGAHLLAAPLVSTIGVAGPLLGALAPEAGPFAEVLHAIAAGAPAAAAVGFPVGGVGASDGVRLEEGRLTGRLPLVADGPCAEFVAIGTVDGDVTVVEASGPGVVVEPVASADPTRPLATVTLDRAVPKGPVVPVTLLGRPLDAALVALSAELVGVGQACLDRAVAHARSRVQFGRPIGSFQGLKHRLADVHVALERARTLVYHAAMVLDDPSSAPADCELAAAAAKAASSEAAVSAAKTAVQAHGALGITVESGLVAYLRRARLAACLGGDHHVHYGRVGRGYLEGAERHGGRGFSA